MNVILDTKDIRFSDSKINILLRGGVVSRDVLRNSVNNIIDMYDVPLGLAKRINDITAIDVKEDKELNNWYHIVCGDTEELAAAYSKKTDTEEIEVSFSCDPKLSEEAIDKAADAVVRRFSDMNSDSETFLEDSATVSEEVKVERVYGIEESSEDEEYDEVDDDHSDDEEEEEETTTVETSSNSNSQPQQNNTNNVYRRQVNNKKRRR